MPELVQERDGGLGGLGDCRGLGEFCGNPNPPSNAPPLPWIDSIQTNPNPLRFANLRHPLLQSICFQPGLKLPPPTPKAKVEEKEHKEPVQHTAEEETALASKEGEDAMDVDVAPCDKEKRLVLIPAAADSSKKAEAEELSKDVLFKGHMKRWKAIKKDRSRQHRLNSERFEDRLKLLLDNK